MIKEKRNLNISGADKNEFLNIIRYEDSDINLLKDFYITFMKSNEVIRKLGGKRLYLPPEFVEAAVAYKMNYWKIDDIHHNFDCYDPNSINGLNRIEVKYSIGRIDISSFSQEMKWDRLNFVKLYTETPTSCFLEIYDININTINDAFNHKNDSSVFNYKYGPRLRVSIMQQFIEKGIYDNKTEFSLF